MKDEDRKYLKKVYLNNFEIGEGDKEIDESTYEVDKAYDSAGIIFLSEWFFDEHVHKYTGISRKFFDFSLDVPTQYHFPDSFQKLNNKIRNFHKKEGFYEKYSEIFITEGSTPMISSIVIWAKSQGFDSIFAISPLYFTIFKIAETLDISILPVNKSMTFDSTSLNLPNKKTILFLTDPIWSMGIHHPIYVFEELRKWQANTKSIIFVDESFSYMDWYSKKKEQPSKILDPKLTFRLICPTKTLALNGLRFSYLICPGVFKQEISRITCCTIGSSSYLSYIARYKIFNKMIRKEVNPIGLFSKDRFLELRDLFDFNKINYINPECGFFMFAELKNFFIKKNLLDKYMWIPNEGLDIFQKKYENYAKLNLIMRGESYSKFLKDLKNG